MRVLISDKFAKKGLEVLQQAAGLQIDYRPGVKGDELIQALADAEALIIRSETKVTAEVLAQAPRLKAVGRAGVGVDNVDLPAASRRGIVVMNTPGGNNVAAGEHTLALMMALMRKIPQAHSALKAGRWEKSKFMGSELFRKTLGVIGFGNVGRIVVRGALGLGMRVLVHDPFVVAEKIAGAGAVPAGLDELLAQADLITLHVPQGEKTAKLINAGTIAKMKDGVRIINCARGGLIEDADLVEALKSGKVAGAALDVFAAEPLTTSPYFELENVIVTPHLGASTSEAQENVAIAIAEQIIDFLQNGVIKNAVNAPAVEPEMLERMSAVLELTERAGRLIGQLLDEAPRTIKLFIGGDFAVLPDQPIIAAALAGLLKQLPGEATINYINAPYLAQERGIEVTETRRQRLTDFTNVVGIKAVTTGGGYDCQVSLPAPHEPRIVRLNGYPITLAPRGILLVLTNRDVPGVVGDVGTLLGRAGINIGELRLGRNKGDDHALMVISIDSRAPDEVLRALGDLPAVQSAKQVFLN